MYVRSAKWCYTKRLCFLLGVEQASVGEALLKMSNLFLSESSLTLPTVPLHYSATKANALNVSSISVLYALYEARGDIPGPDFLAWATRPLCQKDTPSDLRLDPWITVCQEINIV